MKLLDVITAAGARTSGGDPYQWNCFGENAQYLEFRDADGNGCSHCIFDTKDYTVYQIHADVPGTDQAFQWTNPQYVMAYINECKSLNIDPDEAWDDVKYTIVNDEETILKYIKDIGETYYDNLPIAGEDEPFKMEMPGTIGSAKLVFPEEKEMSEQYMVKLDVRFELDVTASSADEALEKARHFQETMRHNWGEGENITWHDKYVVKEAVERTLEY